MPSTSRTLLIADALLILTVILLSMMEVLDMTVVNVALLPIAGNLHVTISQVTWVVTGYIIGSAIIMPVSGVFVKKYGRKRILLIAVTGFTVASFLCGIVSHFELLLALRIIQGLFGASLVPLSQYIIISTVDKKHVPVTMACWGLGVLIAPILGPILGGYITTTLGWRFIFFMNAPVAIIAFMLVFFLLSESETNDQQKIDYYGFTLLAIAIGCLQFILSRGSAMGGLDSKLIVYLTLIFIGAMTYFIIRGVKIKSKNIFDFSIFSNRKFILSTLTIFIMSGIIMGVGAILPLFLEKFLHYTSLDVGLVTAPAGLGTIVGMFLATLLLKLFDGRWIMLLGLAIAMIAIFTLSKLTLTIMPHWLTKIYILRSFGFGLLFVPLVSIAFLDLAKNHEAIGAGIFNFARNMGGSIGITLASSNLNFLSQTHWHALVHAVTPYAAGFKFWLVQQDVAPGLTYNNPIAIFLSLSQVASQAYLKAYSELFLVFSLCFLLCIPLIIGVGRATIRKLSIAG
jgi:DHA2 family multidrug resistance protein